MTGRHPGDSDEAIARRMRDEHAIAAAALKIISGALCDAADVVVPADVRGYGNAVRQITAERDALRAEVERLRSALADAVEGMTLMRRYVPDTFAEDVEHGAYLTRGREALQR